MIFTTCMNKLLKILKIFKKKQKVDKQEIKKQVEEKPDKIVLSWLPEVPGYQAQTEVIIEDEGVDIEEEENNE